MIVIDTSGWVEYLTDGPLATVYAEYVRREDVLVPTVVLYEVYKLLRRTVSDEVAEQAAGRLKETNLVTLNQGIALAAADMSLEHGLPMADAIIYATAQTRDALVVTSDAHFQGLPGVEFVARG